MTDIVIEQFDFSHLVGGHGHVLIHAYVGKMPPQRWTSYLMDIREHTPLCNQLTELGIEFTIVPMHDKVEHEVVKTITVETEDTLIEDNNEAHEAYDRARM